MAKFKTASFIKSGGRMLLTIMVIVEVEFIGNTDIVEMRARV